jgi:hypothetical protein
MMPHRVEVSYPAPLSVTLDEHLDQLATQHSGTWFGSGIGLVPAIAERDIEFQFASLAAAEGFVQACQAVAEVQVRASRADGAPANQQPKTPVRNHPTPAETPTGGAP